MLQVLKWMCSIRKDGGFNVISNESKLSSAVASLSMEGLTVTDEEIQLAKKCLRHEITYDDAVSYLINKYSASS